MKKLSELKENEAIYIANKKEAKAIEKIFNGKTKPVNYAYMIGLYLIRENISYKFVANIKAGIKKLPSSAFIPKKTSFKKEVLKELARFDGRLFNLELDRKIQEHFNRVSCRTDENGNGILFQPDGPSEDIKQPLTELPATWRVKVTPENAKILTEWKRKVSNGYFDTHSSNYDFITEKGEGINHTEYGTEISYQDFKRLVLDAEPKEKEIDWSVPGLFINLSSNEVVQSNGKHTENGFEGMCLINKLNAPYCFITNWGKKYFKPYTGEPITLSNS